MTKSNKSFTIIIFSRHTVGLIHDNPLGDGRFLECISLSGAHKRLRRTVQKATVIDLCYSSPDPLRQQVKP